jgi:hypothetical protein
MEALMSVDLTGRRATRIAKVVVDVSWWLGLLLSVVLVALFVTAPLLEGRGYQVTFEWASFEVDDGAGPPGLGLLVAIPGSTAGVPTLSSPDTLQASAPMLVRDGPVELQFRTRQWGFLYGASLLLLPLMTAFLVVLHLLRSILADVLRTSVFTVRNAKRLSTLGWLLIAIGVAGPWLERWRGALILRRLDLDGVALAAASSDTGMLWLVGVFALVLAAAWRYGAELELERHLTV